MLKHYVECVYPGAFVSETSVKEVKSRNEPIGLPKGSFGYRFFDQTETKEGKETLIGKRKNHSGWHYKGEAYTLAQVETHFPDHSTLIWNMRNNGFKRVLKCYQGFIPLRDEDKVI